MLLLSFVVPYGQWALEHQHQVIKRVPTTHQVVALTIDDGPYGKTTQDTLAVLKEKGVKATFFILGCNAEKTPELLAQEVYEGHELALHGYSHTLMTRMPVAQAQKELSDLENLIQKYTEKPRLFRPPGGAYNDTLLQEWRKKGYEIILWDVDPHDWQRRPASEIVKTVVAQVKPGSIILLHDGQPGLHTSEAIGQIVDQLQGQGYRFVTVSELLQYYEEK